MPDKVYTPEETEASKAPASENPFVKEVVGAINNLRVAADALRDAIDAARANKAAISETIYDIVDEMDADGVLVEVDELEELANELKAAEGEGKDGEED
jgi:hypothetical protein